MIYMFFMMQSQRKLNETYTGGIGSFVLASMIVSFLQQRYRLTVYCQAQDKDCYNHNLASLLLGFLSHYGGVFNYYTTGISLLEHGSYFNKIKKYKGEMETSNNNVYVH